MKRTLSLLVAGIAGVFIAFFALSFATQTFAQGPGGQPAQPATGIYGNRQMGRGHAGQGGMGGQANSLVGMAAAELGITQADLVAQLGTDGTIADALTNGGKDPAAFIDAFVATRTERLEAALAAGALTREEVDTRVAIARSMSTARIYQAFTALGPGGQGPNQDAGYGAAFVDANGDGVCDLMPAGGQGALGGGRGPRR